MLLPISLAVVAVAIYVGWQQEFAWLDPTYLQVLLDRWTSDPRVSVLNTTKNEEWDILYHLGGNGPWIPKVDGIFGDELSVPEGCQIEQVHMVGAFQSFCSLLSMCLSWFRWRDTTSDIQHVGQLHITDMVALHNRLRTLDFDLQGDLAFFGNWTFFMAEDYEPEIGELVPTGPYAGSLGAFQAGVTLRTRYPDLRATAIARNQTNFWAADSHRVVETAKYFAAGFWGVDWASEIARLHVIPESAELGANTLTTGNTCKAYLEPHNHQGRHKGLHKLEEWQSVYITPIIQRLEQQNPGLNLSIQEVFSMQEFCGFELLARGSSPWCNVFTHDEWRYFEYARDILHYYRTGPGNKYSAGRGFPFLNATANLLSSGVSAGPLFFSFVHDGDILPLLSALDLFPSAEDLPTDRAPEDRVWKTSSIVPMGGRIEFERMVCPYVYCHSNAPLYPNHVYCDPPHHEPYVRVVVNDGVVPIPGCDDGPGKSCPLAAFERRVMLRGWEVGDFGKLCGLEEGAADKITFLHQ
ncbi:phosphoglycerate mutase-like protein [Aureobasidium sp. EXF-10727]|nr:phosphoglycerate mutase-like protein [Aureobasidium sp. EXF-10727]